MLSLMRYHCSNCQKPFRPKRTDAEYCGPACRQAAHRGRERAEDEAAKAKAKLDELAAIGEFASYQSVAALLHGAATAVGLDVAFIGALDGVLAVEGHRGAFESVRALVSATAPYLKPALADRALTAILMPSDGAPFIVRETAKDFRNVLARGGNVIKFRADQNYVEDRNRAASACNDSKIFSGPKPDPKRRNPAEPDAPLNFPNPRGLRIAGWKR